ncbi:hypothetical protein GCM10011586_37960 [Silvibacterium dinghuense]|nr:hypothetical protein GCM10011586_37960 [Silvibacterium dinghuense]
MYVCEANVPGLNETVREYVLSQYVRPAREQGLDVVRINAGEVHRSLRWVNRVPSVCTALGSQRLQRETGLELIEKKGPPSGFGTRAEFTYRIARPESTAGQDVAEKKVTLDDLYGLFSGMFPEPGGMEAWIRKERAAMTFRPDPNLDPELDPEGEESL